jgi:hypothetical protein
MPTAIKLFEKHALLTFVLIKMFLVENNNLHFISFTAKFLCTFIDPLG